MLMISLALASRVTTSIARSIYWSRSPPTRSSNEPAGHSSRGSTTTPIVQELQRQTRTIPIVFASIGDPVDTIVESLARPGGNATGFSNWEPAMGGKPLALLKEVAPGVNRMLVMVNSGSDSNQHEVRANEVAAQGSTGQVLLPPPE